MTIHFPPVQDFDRLPFNEANRIVYDELLPYCQSKGVQLCQYGNLNSHLAYRDFQDPSHAYYTGFSHQTLLNIGRIQRAYRFLPDFVTPTSKYQINSDRLARMVEVIQEEHLSNGDLIAAMLMRGYAARFAKRGGASQVDAEFKAKRLV
jgi:hypothetical protein